MIMLRLAYAALAISSTALAFQQEAERDKDVYAIYSLMLTNLQTSHGPYEGDRYLIAAVTGPANPQEPCVRPPAERETDFREALTDYLRRRGAPRELKAQFKIEKPYFFLSSADVAAFEAERSRPDGRFRGVSDLIILSDVYFNQRRTLALSAISTWCGSLCSMHQWKAFEKSESGEWRERDWGTCSAVAEVRRTGAANGPR
ncbi:MAG TPA: hypothetical protein VKV74_01445 [Bryobacteraceae bacterium]|nr:hypothetical protein [Bryobacteraceae bacterium]